MIVSAFPYFFLALMGLLLFNVTLHWVPLGFGYSNTDTPGLDWHYIGDVLYHAILPATVILVTSVGGWVLTMRNNMISTLSEDYVRMARAKGLSPARIMFAYAGRNAVLPNLTGFAMSLGFVVSGAILVEYVFSYPGVGYMLLSSGGERGLRPHADPFPVHHGGGPDRHPGDGLRHHGAGPPRPHPGVGGAMSGQRAGRYEHGSRARRPGLRRPRRAGRRFRAGPVGGLVRAIASNRKATAGFVILVVFCFLAAFPGLIAHDNPQAEMYCPTLGPSGAHLLGTTAYGQDLFAQLIYSTRESLFIAVAAGALATVLSVIVGVTAAYLGGLADNLLSLVTDIFLVIPAFPLIVVIAAYSKNGGDPILIAVLVVTGWSYGARQLRVQASVYTEPGLPGGGPATGRAALAGDRVGDAAHDDVVDSGHFPRAPPCTPSSPLPACSSWGWATPTPELGDHALLGAEQRGPSSRVPLVGDHARGRALPCWAPLSPC